MGTGSVQQIKHRVWVSRIIVGAVFLINIHCAFSFFLFPENYRGAYGLSGVPGNAAIQGLAVAFLMWNVTYPFVIVDPIRFRSIFVVVLIQQSIGLIGESLILAGIGDGYDLLTASIVRFIIFDGSGLLLMVPAFIWLFCGIRKNQGRSVHAEQQRNQE